MERKETVKLILDFLDEHSFNMSYVKDYAGSFVDEAYEHMKEEAKLNNCFIENKGTLYNHEKFYFKFGDGLYNWGCVFASIPYYMFEKVDSTSYPWFAFNYGAQVD